MSSQLHKKQLGKVSSKARDRKLKTKKRTKKKIGKRRTRWKCNGRKTRSWRRSWNEEGGKEALCRRKSCKKVFELVVHERMSQGKKSEGYKRKEARERVVYCRDKRYGEQFFGGRRRRNEDMEIFEPRGDGSMLEERLEVEDLDKYKAEDSKREACRGRGSPAGVEACTTNQDKKDKEVGRRLLGKTFRFV